MPGDHRHDARRIIEAMNVSHGAPYLDVVQRTLRMPKGDFESAIQWMVDCGYLWKASAPKGEVAYPTDRGMEFRNVR